LLEVPKFVGILLNVILVLKNDPSLFVCLGTLLKAILIVQTATTISSMLRQNI